MLRYQVACICFCLVCIAGGCASTTQSASGKSGIDGKDTLLIFVGSDWSDDAYAFTNHVLTESCKARLAEKYAVRIIDLLHKPLEDKRKETEKSYLLFSEYAVPDVPFVVLETAYHDRYASTVIDPKVKTKANLVEKIEQLAKQHDRVRMRLIHLRKQIDSTKGVEKARAIDALLHAADNAGSARYDSLRMQVPELDPDNVLGLKGAYVLMVADIRARRFARQGEYRKAGDEYKTAAEMGGLSSADLQRAWYLTAYSYLMAENFQTKVIIEYLQRAVDADPQSAAVQQITQAMQKLKQDAERAKNTVKQ